MQEMAWLQCFWKAAFLSRASEYANGLTRNGMDMFDKNKDYKYFHGFGFGFGCITFFKLFFSIFIASKYDAIYSYYDKSFNGIFKVQALPL